MTGKRGLITRLIDCRDHEQVLEFESARNILDEAHIVVAVAAVSLNLLRRIVRLSRLNRHDGSADRDA